MQTKAAKEASRIKEVLDAHILSSVIDVIFKDMENFDSLDVDMQIKISSLITKGYHNYNTPKA